MSRGKFVYKDQSSMDKMLAFYDRAMESLNVHYREEYIETSYGTTHIVIAGDETKKPIFTVHGGNGITPLNLKLFLPLLRDYCLITPDVIGMPGKSAPYRTLNTNKDDYGRWLVEILDILKIDRIPFVVSSYSSAMLLSLAQVAPQRIEKAALVVPSGIAHGPLMPILRSMTVPMLKYYFVQSDRSFKKIMQLMATEDDEQMERSLLWLGDLKRMALLRTGSDILTYIQTSCFSLTIKGSASHPSFPGVSFQDKESVLRITSDETVDTVDSCADFSLVSEIHKEHYHAYEFQLIPLFFEQQRYEIIIEPEENHTVEFWHENYNIRNKVTPTGRKGTLLTGEINFGNDIGFSDLLIKVDGNKVFKLTIEVFPSKISYKDDYKAIVADITTEVYNLVFDFLKKTYSSFDISTSQQSSMVEFFAIIRKIYDEFVRAADMVLRNPHHQLISEHQVLPSHKIKKTDTATVKWLERHPEYVVRDSDSRIRCDKALGVKKYVTYDTKENRLVKYMLSQTARRLNSFERLYCKKNKDIDSEVVSIVDSMIKGINRRFNTGVLKDIDAAALNTGMSLVFGMAPGYRELYRSYLLLQHGLSVSGNLFDVSVKDIAVLYEYWCFIKLNSIMKKKYQLISQDIIKTSGNGLSVTLKKGSTSKVKYINPSTGERIILSYNPTEQNLPTVPQIPDNVLRVEKYGANTDYEYVFDAKYRINPALPGSGYLDKIPGPEVDTINTMHRYRDAIVYQSDASPYERTMFGAYVLFPYHDEKQYINHRFYKSIKQVNIGGLPFLPTATSLVEELLEELVSDSSESAFERTTLPRGIESRLSKVDWSKRDVLVGSVKSPYQLNDFLDNREFFVESSFIKDDAFPIRYVALYQGKSTFGANAKVEYYGEVKTAERIKGTDIALDDKQYYLFTVVEWKKLPRPIEPREIGTRIMFTNLFLLQHSSQVPELYLNSEAEYRMFYELKRRTEANVLNNNETVDGIEVEDFIISFDEGEILLSSEGKIRDKYAVQEFTKRPNLVFRRILDSMHNCSGDVSIE